MRIIEQNFFFLALPVTHVTLECSISTYFQSNCMKLAQSAQIYIPNIHVNFYLDISKTLSFIENNIIRILQTSTYAK